MSTDVYIDFNEDEEECETVRIGHLGIMGHDIMRYHNEDLIERFRTLHTASGGIVHEWVPEAAARLCKRFEYFVKKVESDTPYYAAGRPMWDKGFDDFPTAKSIAGEFQENIGKTWGVRID